MKTMANAATKSKYDERLYPRAEEAAVLGSIILDPACFVPVAKIVGVDSFVIPEHKIIAQTLFDLKEEGSPIDGLILRNRLAENKQLDEIGGVEYLKKLVESVPSSANAEFYASKVVDAAKRRLAVEVHKTIGDIIESDCSANELLAEIHKKATGLEGYFEPIESSAVVINLADVEEKPVEWLWHNRIPQGMFTLLAGDPGLGKSYLSLDIAARISRGTSWSDKTDLPENKAPLGSVIVLTAEDPLAQVVKPRLRQLGADLSKVSAIESVQINDPDRGRYETAIDIANDLPALRKAIKPDTKLIIIDPISAYYGKDTDNHRDADLRRILRPVCKLAEDTGVAILAISHLNKSATGKAIYRALGSIALIAAARTAWLLTNDPDEPESDRRLLTPCKHNILVKPTGLAFEINDGRLVYETEPISTTSDEALGGSTVEVVKLEQAVEWLREVVTPGNAISSTELSAKAEAQGIKKGTLQRAKKPAGVISYQLKTDKGIQWFCRRDKQ
jgi:replicative DNA helicase